MARSSSEILQDHLNRGNASAAGAVLTKKPTKKAVAAAARGQREARFETESRAAVRHRQGWERSAIGQGRLRDITSGHPGVSPGQMYEAGRFNEEHLPSQPHIYDRQLPGMADPDAAPQQKRWEEYTPEEQSGIAHRIRHSSGATVESMQRSFGAQLDQSYQRAERHMPGGGKPAHDEGLVHPYGQNFYSSGEPAQVIHRTAHEMGVSPGLVAALHADNSPNTPFYIKGRYPQDEMARAAISHVQAGGSPETVQRPKGSMGFTGNLRKATERARQVINEGVPLSETRASDPLDPKRKPTSPPPTKFGMGPKTGAYHNSWLPSTPDFFVSDVHSGGGGMIPHLGFEERTAIKKTGGTRPHKSEREQAMETVGFHAMADYSARRAMQQRGLGYLRQAQASQWGEERHRRGLLKESETFPKAGETVTGASYPGGVAGQRSLFADRRSEGRRA